MPQKQHIYSFLMMAICGIAWLLQSACQEDSQTCSENLPSYPEVGCLRWHDADNDREYDWYRTQMGTGPEEGNNCGPTSVAMAIYWFDPTLDVPPGDIRDMITPGARGWWYTTDIAAALDAWEVPYRIREASHEAIQEALDAGFVLLFCLNMGYITRAENPKATHFDRFYAFDSGHFLIVKGHFWDGQWLIVYDPNNWYDDYYDEAHEWPLGKNRYYNSFEVLTSAQNWWPYFFEIGISDGKRHDYIPVGRSGP